MIFVQRQTDNMLSIFHNITFFFKVLTTLNFDIQHFFMIQLFLNLFLKKNS